MTPPITACVWRVGPRMMRDQIKVHEVQGLPVGTIRYAVRRSGWTLNKEGDWEHEPIPSSRDDAYIGRCRWADFESAMYAAIRVFEAEWRPSREGQQ